MVSAYNSNIAGYEEGRIRFLYNGGTSKFVAVIDDVAANGYQEIEYLS